MIAMDGFTHAPVREKTGLRLENVTFSYNGALVLRDINLAVRAGEFLTLLGPSGSGKTTLLRLIAGLELPSSGQITCGGVAVNSPGKERGMVFQEYTLFPWMDLRENIALAIEKADPRLRRKERSDLAEMYLGLVGLRDQRGKYAFELSGGMQQRGAIARVLALGSPYLLMDEPFGALDPLNRMRLQDLLLGVTKNASPSKTVIFVTHDLDEALYLGDRVVILGSSPGKIIAEIPVILSRPRSRPAFFTDRRIQRLREEILGHYRHEAIEQLENQEKITTGEGI